MPWHEFWRLYAQTGIAGLSLVGIVLIFVTIATHFDRRS